MGEHGQWQLLIVEDDAAVASMYRRALRATPEFEVRGVVTNGEDALAFLQRWPCDLVLLDLHLAGMNGVALLRRLRESDMPVEVIAVTAVRNAKTVRSVVQRGALDYLVKPFSIERLQQSLALFVSRATALAGTELDQFAIDRICAGGEPRRHLPKGLTQEGVEKVRRALAGQARAVSSADVAGVTDLARVTARRYLEYLVASGQATVEAIPSGAGRPRKLYEASTA